MSNFAWARNTTTGKVVRVPEHYLGHPVLGKDFVPAQKGDKDYLPELFKPQTAYDFQENRKSRKKEIDVPQEIVIEEPVEEVAE
jgi:hypothetical protein